jgi:eukaryotic-like serine/threonine-protein kinase
MNIIGSTLRLANQGTSAISDSVSFKVTKELGRGSQGTVYEVLKSNGETIALKAYPASYINRDRNLEARIRELVYIGSPHSSFLWPNEFLELTDGASTFKGYTMPIRAKRFISSTTLMSGKLEVDFRSLIHACRNLSEAFFHLHSQGLCYKDLSFGNFFFDPANGECIICDIDNICYSGEDGGVLGTPGFMAPEIVTGQQRPSAASDLHSLAVLIFYMLYINHPLEGKTEITIKIMDDIARRKVYGSEPLYIFDPRDTRNRPDPDIHANALTMNEILPKRLKQVFEKAFVNGLKDPNYRVVESEWQLVLDDVLETLGHCSLCGQEVFLDGLFPGLLYICWACNESQYPIILVVGDEKMLVRPGGKAKDLYGNPLGTVIRHPQDKKLLGLKNETGQAWAVIKANGIRSDVEPGRSVVLGPGVVIQAGSSKMTVLQGLES